MRKLTILILVTVLLLSNTAFATWYRGTIHLHSTFSDGDRTPAMLKNAASALKLNFMVVTDHVNSITKEKKDIRTDLVTDDFGFDKYVKDFSTMTPILCLAGAEITTKQGSHILAIPDKTDIFGTEWAGKDQQVIIGDLNASGAISIAAHPSVDNYLTEHEKAKGLTCVEVFNESATNGKKTRDWILETITNGIDVTLTAGNDSHTSAEPTDVSRWQRATFVWVDGPLTKSSLVTALKSGWTYATAYGVYLSSINVLPGKTTQDVEKPKFTFTFTFPIIATSAKTVRVYRDGKLVGSSVKKFALGKASYTYDWEDEEATKGNHVYLVEVEGCLLTSPIHLNRTTSPAPQTQTFTGGAPILLGKSTREVLRILGNPTLLYDLEGFSPTVKNSEYADYKARKWFYLNSKTPFPPFNAEIFFVPYNHNSRRDISKDPWSNKVKMVSFHQGSLSRYRGILPKQLVPKEILSSPPFEICYYNDFTNNALLVIWHYDGNTFALGVRDSRRQLYDKVVGLTRRDEHYVLNNAGRDFRNADDAFEFIQIAGIHDYYGDKEYWESYDTQSGFPMSDRGHFTGITAYFFRFKK